MKSKLILAFMLISFRAGLAQASATTVRGGGHGVVCMNLAPQVLDLYELRRERPFHMENFGPSKQINLDNFLPFLRDRFTEAGINPKLTSRIVWSTWLLSTAFTKGAPGTRVSVVDRPSPASDDMGKMTVDLPFNCSVVQIGTVFPTVFGLVWQLDYRVFTEMSDLDKSAFVIHEALHDYFVIPSTTSQIRDAVKFIFSNESYRQQHREEFRSLFDRVS